MKSGDTVKHIPSDETWLVAMVDGDDLWPCGWPETLAKIEDCVLIRSCSAEKHEEMLKSCIRMGRCTWLAQRALEDLHLAFIGAYI